MAALRAFIRKHPLPSYFALTFLLSWGCIVLAVWAYTGGLSPTPEQFQLTVPYTVPAMLLGPAVATLLLTGVVSGGAGYRDLGSRLVKWRVAGRWYALALLIAPVTMAAVLLTLWLTSSDYAPRLATSGDKGGLLAMGALVGASVGLLEEVGWTGFAIPKALQRWSVLGTGVLIGVVWTAWHFFVIYWGGGGENGGVPLGLSLSLWGLGLFIGQLTAYRVLMVWAYEQTGSLLVAVLMHFSLAAFQIILNPLTPGWPQQIYGLGYAAAAWAVVGAVALARRADLGRHARLASTSGPS